jgi:hypothetical protein
MSVNRALQPLRPLERLGLVVLALGVVGFGVVTLMRSAFLSRPMTDADVFFRAAWAIRSGADLYSVTDVNGWHYLYPSLFAILMWPFAAPPPGQTMAWTMSFPWAVGLWYALGVVFLAVGAHWLARAVECCSEDPQVRDTPAFCRRWWALRVWPGLICAIAFASALGRGQVGTLLLMLLAGMLSSAARGRSFRAGLWLAAAITLKVIPAFLLLYPLWRRDGRWLAGAGVGLALGLVVLPSLVLGPKQTWDYNVRWVQVMFLPTIDVQSDPSRFDELHTMHKIDNQAPVSIIHHWRWFGVPLQDRPTEAALSTKAAHLAVGSLATLATLLAAGLWRPRAVGGDHVVLVVGLLLCVMLMVTPVCHPDYFALACPLIAALFSRSLQQRASADISPVWWLGIGVYVLANALPKFESLVDLKMYGLAGLTGIALWALGTLVLARDGGHAGPGLPRFTLRPGPAKAATPVNPLIPAPPQPGGSER